MMTEFSKHVADPDSGMQARTAARAAWCHFEVTAGTESDHEPTFDRDKLPNRMHRLAESLIRQRATARWGTEPPGHDALDGTER